MRVIWGWMLWELNMCVFHITWDVSHLPQVPYIHFADNDVAQSSENTARCVESSQRRAFPPDFHKIIQVDETGELMTPSIVHGDILLWLVECLLVGGMAAYTVCMNWFRCFRLAIGPVHICCRQYRGTNPCERGAQCGHGTVGWTQSKSVPPGRQEETLYSNWWVNDTINRAWRYIVVACRMSSCGGYGCVHCLHELIQIFPTCHRSRTYMLQTISWHQPVWTRSPVGTLNGVSKAVEERSLVPSRENSS